MKLSTRALLKTQAYVNGEWCSAEDGTTFAVHNPANGAKLADVARCGAVETDKAIDAAHAAQATWKNVVAKDRAALLRRWFELMMSHQEDLAHILTAEQGKPLAEARSEIAYGASYVEWFAEEAKRVYGDTIAPPSNDKRLVCIKQPVGVVACITPWNFPNAMLTRKIAPALAAGCTVVCKPANATPLSALAIAQLAHDAGIPKGVINVVAGHTSAIGETLTSNPLVRKLTFTGSTAVGKQLQAACAGTMKRTSMELGGNAPFIVFDDADMDAAIAGAMSSKFRNAGQTCVCTNRFLIQDTVYEEFLARLTSAVDALRVGEGTDDDVDMGPLISQQAANDVQAIVDDAISHGAKKLALENPSESWDSPFFSPTILTDVTPDMRAYREEIFGPVAALYTFSTEREAIDMANDTEVGLACYFYSRDIGRVWRVSEQLEFGIVGVNEGLISNEMAPFGGIKESGQGREGSRYGMDDYLEIKYLCMGGI